MQHRVLGRSGIEVSLLSLGTGGASQFGQKTGVDDAGRKKLVRKAIDLGVNLFDTAAVYGRSEELLGRALEGVPRDRYLLATKWSHRPTDELVEPQAMISGVERSLRLLNTDVIDVMQFHGILPQDYDILVERYLPTLQALRDQGKVRLIGFTEMMRQDPKHSVPLRALKEHPELWDVIMLKYGILNQWAAKEVLSLAEKHGVAILNMAPVRSTLTRDDDQAALFDEWRRDGTVDLCGLDEQNPFGWLLHDDVESVIDAGYRFAAMNDGISTVISGTSNVEHLVANARSLESATLSEPDHRRLVEIFSESAAPN